MANDHSVEDLLDFLNHASERGLMPAASAQALAVAARNVFAILDDKEREALPLEDIDPIIKRFNTKRARDFNPTSLKEYGRRVKRAVDLYLRWKEDPANFSVKTRSSGAGQKRKPRGNGIPTDSALTRSATDDMMPSTGQGPGYETAFPIRPGQVVTMSNIPHDLSKAEAERLAQFIRLLPLGT